MSSVRGDSNDHFVTWPEVHRDAKELVRKLIHLPQWKGIVAIARGGLVPATIIARELEIRFVDTLCIASYLDEQKQGGINVIKVPDQAVAEKGANWLMIDDLVDTGATMKKARELLPHAHVATVYAKPDGMPYVDTFVHEVPQTSWVFFPWDTEPPYIAPMVQSGPRTE